MALLGPIPFICWSSFNEQSNRFTRPNLLISLLDISITFSPTNPVLSIIANNSASLNTSGPYFRNLSLGLEESGRSLIFICLEKIKQYKRIYVLVISQQT